MRKLAVVSATGLIALWLVVGQHVVERTAQAQASTHEQPRGSQKTQGQQQGVTGNLSTGQIARALELINRGEVQEGQLAQQRATSSAARGFGDRMVRDHSQALDDLQQAMKRDHIDAQESAISRQMTQGEQQRMQRLRDAQGSDFDRAYIDAQVSEHEKGVALIDANLSNIDNRDFRGVVQEQRDMIAEHLDHARSVQRDMQARASR